MKERELPGIRLEGEWRWPDAPQPPRAPSHVGIETARKLTALKWTIDVAEVGRMRVRFASRTLPLPAGTELRARLDHYGHLLVWPDGSRYRALSPGAVRTLLGERRADVTPLARPQLSPSGLGARRFGLPTRRMELSTRTGSLALEIAKIPEAGEGGPLLCRLFGELVASDPTLSPCSFGEVPLRALFSWPSGARIGFEVTAMQHRPDIPASLLLMPPLSALSAPADLPPSGAEALLSPNELAALRGKPLELGSSPAPSAPTEGLVAFNGTDLPQYLIIDGIAVAWIAAWQEFAVPSLLPGRYVVGFRSFFGDSQEPPTTVEVPARVAIGVAKDARAGN